MMSISFFAFALLLAGVGLVAAYLVALMMLKQIDPSDVTGMSETHAPERLG